jgi:carbohydrate-binding DOMON domain-containing protein
MDVVDVGVMRPMSGEPRCGEAWTGGGHGMAVVVIVVIVVSLVDFLAEASWGHIAAALTGFE